ncbi:MAG: hypothetical protein QOI25_3440 [Mycobacterium sp.]|nr:hypothetical protein [Mycobacterium sp.]
MSKFVAFAGAVLSTLALASSASAATTATLSTTSGPPGALVTVHGTGFDASTEVDIFYDTTDLALASSSSSGAVSFTITLPTSAQPGTHWITLNETRTHAAAQAPFTVRTTWPQGGFGPSQRGFNPFENTITTDNVNQLTEAWATPVSSFGNAKPFIIYGGNLYVIDEDEHVHAYTAAGKLLWTATPAVASTVSQLSPAGAGGLVYFADANGKVYAYNYVCRSDGGVCTPNWTTKIGTPAVGVTYRNGVLYVPGQDGLIHVLNATTGVQRTSVDPLGSGALTSPVSIGDDGTLYVAEGTAAEAIFPSGKSNLTYAGNVSPIVVGDDTAFMTTSDGYLQQMFGWTTAVIGSGCDIPPAYAYGVVYAAGCSGLGAYDAGTGSAIWTVSTASQPYGLSVANGVLYGCVGGRLTAYAASYGGHLWNGGTCSERPLVANGIVYDTTNNLTASTLTGARTTSMARRRARRPDPRRLRPSARLHRRRKQT